MSAGTHLGIDIADYDARIRTFIPRYEEMLQVAADAAAAVRPKTVVELGIGTGALSARIAAARRSTRLVGIDADEAMLTAAQSRLMGRRPMLRQGDFVKTAIPRCEAIVASFALHHVPTAARKRALYRRLRTALGPRGRFVSADCHPSSLPARAAAGHRAWKDHLAATYGAAEAARYLRAWAKEDVYTPLDVELQALAAAGFDADVVWREGSFAVIAAEVRRKTFTRS